MHQIDRNTGDIDRKQSAPAELIYAHKQCRRVHDPAVDHHGADRAERHNRDGHRELRKQPLTGEQNSKRRQQIGRAHV